MNRTGGRFGSGNEVRERIFLAATVAFLVLTVCVAIQQRSRQVSAKLGRELLQAKNGLARVKESQANRRLALTAIKSQLARCAGDASPEKLVYGKIDEIKARLHPDEITLNTPEKKGGDLALPFTFKCINPDYCDLLNFTKELQQSVFPFIQIGSIELSQAEQGGKGVVAVTISGAVLTPERNKP